MGEGGFLVKFDGKKVVRCYTISFDYDANSYVVNKKDKQKLPRGVKSIIIKVERK